MMGCTSNQDLIMISHHNIRGYHIHKTELQAFLEDHSPDVVTLTGREGRSNLAMS